MEYLHTVYTTPLHYTPTLHPYTTPLHYSPASWGEMLSQLKGMFEKSSEHINRIHTETDVREGDIDKCELSIIIRTPPTPRTPGNKVSHDIIRLFKERLMTFNSCDRCVQFRQLEGD